ncbi:MAG: tetraacyldisaccharide 4'-kinase [Planctomycetaceae bacterium]|jgi:tetraacyldisaccharide 4'-kinase|nr:tetraacyldisaccharide 4'-kinase [Planctomycetaceae bacterium]
MPFDRQTYFDVVSGKRTDFSAKIGRGILSAMEIPYAAAMEIRNLLYDNGLRKIQKLPIPVVSVGNLTMGGTGKTPFVARLAKKFLESGKFPAIVSRGYRADSTGWNDEAKELKLLLPNVPQAFAKQRFTAAAALLDQYKNSRDFREIDLVILDDGFQYRKIFRNLEILLIDATNPFGYNRIIPRGFLRESIFSLKRADAVILTRAGLADVVKRNNIREQIFQINPRVFWGEIDQNPKKLLFCSGEKKDFSEIKEKKILGFCGIGNPDGFRKTLESCNCRIQKFITFPDHYHYADKDIQYILNLSQVVAAKYIVCTLKDFVKVKDRITDIPNLVALIIETENFPAMEEHSLWDFLYKRIKF